MVWFIWRGIQVPPLTQPLLTALSELQLFGFIYFFFLLFALDKLLHDCAAVCQRWGKRGGSGFSSQVYQLRHRLRALGELGLCTTNRVITDSSSQRQL